MGLKNFKTRNGIDVDIYTIPNTVIQQVIKTNNITTVDTIPMASFVSAEYLITITQGSKIRTSSVILQTDGTSVDMSEYGVIETGGSISGVVVSATTSSTNAVLQVTITDAATTIARIKISRNLNVSYTPTVPDAPTIGTATASGLSASITFTAPYDNGGASITSYTATSSPGSITGTASSSPVTVSGLTDATAYTFVIAAINAAGTSASSSASNSVTAAAPSYFGYVSGGYSNVGTLSKWNMTLDTSSTTSSTLTTTNLDLQAGHANTPVAGYVQGGEGTTFSAKVAFPTDTITNTSALATARRNTRSAAANAGTAGYVFGGTNQTLSTNRTDYSTDVSTTLSMNFIQASIYGTAHSNNGVCAYTAQGSTSGSNYTTIGEKFVYSTETRTKFITYTDATRDSASFANSGTAGYVNLAGGSYIKTINKVLYSTDAVSTLSATLAVASASKAGFARSGTAGYFGQGGTATGPTGAVEKLTFSSETMSTPAATIAVSSQNASFANSGTL